MHEVKGGPGLQAGDQLRLTLPSHGLPTHVGDLEPGCLEARDRARQHSDPRCAAVLRRTLEQELKAKADAQHGHAGLDPVGDQRVEPGLAHTPHRARECPHAREDHPGGLARGVRVAGDEALGADALEGLLHRPQVSHPVVENGDSRQVSVPFVLGTPGSSGSIDTASRSARANALKHASTMWCALVP